MDLGATDLDASPRTLSRRCVQCPSGNPVCPTCPTGQTCSLSIQSCNACASTSCVADTTIAPSPPSSQNNSQSAAGPIAGGVVGGIVLIVLITYLVYRFCIKNRRREFEETWPDEASGVEKGGDQFSLQRDARASTHTVGSVASSVLTRASNYIQIAYIPGVTNRSVESSPDLIPPVPPIPAASPGSSVASTPHVPTQDQHFFMPDLRDSTFSSYTNRTSIARSMVRNSVASTTYRSSAIVNPVPAQQVTRGKAIPVSVSLKSSVKNSPQPSRSSTPPMPTVSQPKQPQYQLNTKSSIVGRIATPKAVTVVKNTNAPAEQVYELSGSERSETPLMPLPDRRTANTSPPYSNDSSTFDDGSSEDDDVSQRGAQGLIPNNRRSDATTVIQDDSPISPSELVPFNASRSLTTFHQAGPSSPKPSGNPAGKHKHKKSSSLNQIIEDATRMAMREPRHGGLGSYRKAGEDAGPFSDANIAGTP